MSEQQVPISFTKFEGWAIVELYGHQREIGFVTTQYYGEKAMFQIDIPAVPAREITLHRPQWMTGRFLPEGSVVKMPEIAGRSRMVGPGSIYALNPCTEDVAKAELERNIPRQIKLVSLPAGAQLSSPDELDPEIEVLEALEVELADERGLDDEL